MAVLLLWIIFVICHAFLSVHRSLVVTCWERAGLLALLYVMFSCVFVTFQRGVLGQVWYLIVTIPDHCLLHYFENLGLLGVNSEKYLYALYACVVPQGVFSFFLDT